MESGMKKYLVGGAVRDKLLGRQMKDNDWVVVGSTPEEMVARGFMPVGSDFPVFLHPVTHEEYALARTERKVAQGYKGFTVYAMPEVTLEQDLMRRDFTINAMAEDADGNLVDPYGGQDDLKNGRLRHVSDAFAEDPVRILRGARFAARYGFTIAPETLSLMRAMVEQGEVDSLVPERVWQELARGLMEDTPSMFIYALRACGALERILPEVDVLFGVPQPPEHHPEVDTGVHTMMALNDAARHGYSLETRFAVLTHDLGKATTPLDVLPRHLKHEERSADLLRQMVSRLRVPSECRDIALLVARYHTHVHQALGLRPATMVNLMLVCDVWRRPERFEKFLQACASDARGRSGHEDDEYPEGDYMRSMAAAARMVNASEIAGGCKDRSQIPARLLQARVGAVKVECASHRRKSDAVTGVAIEGTAP